MPTTQLLDRTPRLRFAQEADYPLFGETLLPHREKTRDLGAPVPDPGLSAECSTATDSVGESA